MPRGVAIETSGRIGSLATGLDGRVLEEVQFAHGLQHAAGIVPILDRLCAAQAWSPSDLEELYVSSGPGSFTGLRIGITLAKSLAFALGVRIVAVPSVRVLVENAPAEARHAIILLDAKRGQVYAARFERQPSGWSEAEGAHLTRLTEALERAPRPVHLLGEGIAYHRQFIPDDPAIVATGPECWRATASTVARLGVGLAAQGQFADAYSLAPMYIRLPEAEEKWRADHASP